MKERRARSIHSGMASIEYDIEIELPDLSESAGVVFWRAERLQRAGYEKEAVVQLALDRNVDLHLAVELLERGCPADTALRILL